MLKTKPAVITDVGIDMQLRNLNGETIEFTKLVVGDGVYSDSESDPELLRKMVSLKSPKQQFGVSSISMVDNEKIAASTVITNYELEEGYTIRELGLYARIKDDPESEGLVSLSLAEIEDTFPAYDGKVVSRIISRFQFSVSDSDTVQLSYLHDPVALVEDVDAKIAVLQKAIDDATALRASLEAYGMVKLCDSEAVTDSTGLALPATEKNASIEGTLAYQLSQLNTDKSERTGSLPCYTFPFGSYEGMVEGDGFANIKVLHKANKNYFNRGSIIHVQIGTNYGYDTFFIGSTDANYFRILCISYYESPYFAKYEVGNWSEKQYIVT